MDEPEPERKPSRSYAFKMDSRETIQSLKVALTELSLRRWSLKFWVLVAEVRDAFVLELDILWAYDASVDLGRHLR